MVRLTYAPKPGPFSYTCVVSKKVAAHAVDRNRIKRRGRAILKQFEKSLIPGCMCALFFKKEASAGSYQDMKAEISGLLEKARLIRT